MPVEESFWEYFWVTQFYLRAAGILPFGGPPSLWKSILSKILVASPIFYSLYVTVPEINQLLFRSHEDYTVDDLLEAVIIVIAASSGQFRSICIIIHREETVRLLSICKKIWDDTVSADRKVIMTWAKRAKLYGMAYFFFAQGAVIIFVLNTVVKQLSTPINSTTRYYPFRFKADSIPSPQYEVKFTLQVVVCLFGVSFIAASDVIGTLLTLNMCGQLRLVKSWLQNISREKSPVGTEKNAPSWEVVLTKCIRRHQVILDFCSKMEEAYNQIYLLQILGGLYVMGIAGSKLTDDEVKINVKYLIFRIVFLFLSSSVFQSFVSYRYLGSFLSATMGIFCSCWPADNLTTASAEVAQAMYEVPWYRGSLRARTAVAIMLARSNTPTRLTAGKFVVLSLETFLSTVYKALSFCMVLNSFQVP